MRIISVDDERWSSNLIQLMIEKLKAENPEYKSVEFVASFTGALEALEYLQSHKIDLIFLDVEMPEMTGLEFAAKVEEYYLTAKIVFITAYSQYALDAWRTEAIDYILKPFDEDDIKRSLQRAMAQGGVENKRERLKIRCFPRFELIIDDKPMAFKSKKAKELLAYLVHNQGFWINIGTLVYDLFGDWNEKSSKSHFRVVLARLKKELSDYGIENIIETKYGAVRVNISEDICDYYLFLRGNHHLFHGEYMIDYSWAEEENVRLGRICSSE